MIYKYEKRTTTIKEIEILNCPFCGSDDLAPVHYPGEYGYSSSEDFVVCHKCGARSGIIKDSNCGNHMEEAIRKWNTRC